MSKGMTGVHSHTMLKDEWLTPPEIVKSLGVFDLDPCSPVEHLRPWDTARCHFSIEDNGLEQDWNGRVWCNPPYGRETFKWIDKLADHGDGIALIFARTETKGFFKSVWPKADAVFFFEGRLTFYHVSGERASANGGAPSCLVIFGRENIKAVNNSGIKGKMIILKGETVE